MTLSPAFLDELRARTSLSALIGRGVRLTKAGREMKGRCPFHDEKSASFYVNDDKGFYHCFGCSAHGDAIRWMTDHEGMPFLDAVRDLAASAGLDMPAPTPRDAERDRERDAMLEIMGRAQRFFHDAWRGTDGPDVEGRGDAVEYLRRRKIGIDEIDSFGIGYAPRTRRGDPSPLMAALRDVAPDRLGQLGLLKRGDDGSWFDFFRGRITIPVHDHRGRVIGFGARVIGKGEPKYLNSPDTPVFDKGNTLFNVHRAAPAARAGGRVIVVEGYMDVIGLASIGVAEAVAPNGTALTEAQIARLWKLADVPILCFDGDRAGRAAAVRAAMRALPLLQPGKSFAFVSPPDGMDPDDVARGGGLAAVNEMIAAPAPLVDIVWAAERDAGPLSTPEQVAALKTRLRQHVLSIRDRDVREAYGREFADRLNAFAGERSPRRAARLPPSRTASRWPAPPRSRESTAIARGGIIGAVERAVLAGLLRYPDIAVQEVESLVAARFRHPAASALRNAIVDAALAGCPFEIGEQHRKTAEAALQGPLRFSFTRGDVPSELVHADLVTALLNLR